VWLLRVVVGLVLLVVVGSVVTLGQVWYTGKTDDQRRADVLVVLGASQYDGRPSAVFAARLDHAVELYRAGVAPRVLTVGSGLPGDTYTEAGAGASYLRNHGIPDSDLVVVPEGHDTLASLAAAAQVMDSEGWRSAVLVTDPWHTLRSRTMARDLGIDAVTSPVTEGPSVRGTFTQTRYVVREAIGYRFYQMFHRPSPPGTQAPAL
jgi:uncharacterized SAM-binding protein YcdF (DUF218 family)